METRTASAAEAGGEPPRPKEETIREEEAVAGTDTVGNDSQQVQVQEQQQQQQAEQQLSPRPRPPPPQTPSKKSKGRLKKLLKKLHGADASRDVSGLVDRAEWVELRQLVLPAPPAPEEQPPDEQQPRQRRHPISRAGPRISRRRSGCQAPPPQPLGPLVVDVADHRDLLFRLVGIGNGGADSRGSAEGGGGGKNTKRRRLDDAPQRNESGVGGDPAAAAAATTANATAAATRREDDYSPKVPSFASVHNPALVERAAVLEFRCSASQYEDLVGGLRAMTERGGGEGAAASGATVASTEGGGDPNDGGSIRDATGGGNCLAVPTRWFPGLHHPKPASHGMLYATPTARKVSKQSRPAAPGSLPELYSALLELSPSPSEMQAEGYPCLAPGAPAAANAPSSAEKACSCSDDDHHDDGHLLSFENVETASELVRRFAVTLCATTTANGQSQDSAPYVATADRCADKDRAAAAAAPRVCAVDCEMVETTLGRELARITLLELGEFDGSGSGSGAAPTSKDAARLRMDQLVQPRGVVKDYLTQYSGITAQLLEAGPTVELVQVQAALLRFLARNDLLIGHSLENDLHALRLVHPTVLDTAMLFRADGATYKHSLRHLASNLLHRTIQDGSHCSREDAGAALDLAVQRAFKGPNYARHLIRPRPVNLLTRLSQRSTLVCLGTSEWLREHVESRSSIHALSCESPRHPNHKALASWLASPNPARRALLAYGCWTLPDDGACNGNPDGETGGPAVSDALVLVRTLRSQLPPSAVICVALQAEFHGALRLTEQRKVRLNPKSTVRWTEDEEVEWARLVNHCRTGMVYWMTGVKEEHESDPPPS